VRPGPRTVGRCPAWPDPSSPQRWSWRPADPSSAQWNTVAWCRGSTRLPRPTHHLPGWHRRLVRRRPHPAEHASCASPAPSSQPRRGAACNGSPLQTSARRAACSAGSPPLPASWPLASGVCCTSRDRLEVPSRGRWYRQTSRPGSTAFWTSLSATPARPVAACLPATSHSPRPEVAPSRRGIGSGVPATGWR